MTEEQIKEHVSRRFVELIANRGGFKCSHPDPDHGCDIDVTRAVPHTRGGKTRYLDTGERVQLQLKCTCESRTYPSEQGFKYDLEVKTYNDLVYRRDSRNLTPLLLILMVLPDDQDQWVTVAPQELIVRRGAYWYVPPPDAGMSENDASVRIEIPRGNAVGLSFLADKFTEFFP